MITNRQYLRELYLPMLGLVGFALIAELGKHFYAETWLDAFITHVYQPIEVFWLLFLYSKRIRADFYHKSYLIVVFVYAVLAISLSMYVDGFEMNNTASFLLECVLIVYLSLYVMYEQYTNELDETAILSQPFFWVNTANLFFYSVVFFQKAFDNYLMSELSEIGHATRDIVTIANFLLYGMYLIGSLCKRRKNSYT